jgi:phosphoribosylglycinamide formyltransferase 1
MNNLAIAVLISGSGTTLDNLIRHRDLGELPVDFKLVISSNPNAKGLDFAREAEVPTEILSRKQFSDPIAHRDAIFSVCRKHNVQLVVMAGYLDHLLIPEDFTLRVVNIHPSLIPSFSGKGYYGERVHQAALDYGVKISGCTVHFVDNEFDHGPIIAQRSCPIFTGDNAKSLQKRISEVEFELYPAAITAIARGHVRVKGRTVIVDEIV